MIVHDCEQGSEEWIRVRAGIPTSSSFHKIIRKSGEPSTSAQKYMNALLAERLMGRAIDEHVSLWMQRGKDLEAEAAAWYENQRDLDTTPVGFVTNDEGTIGASPDRLVGDEGLVEIKVPAPQTHAHYLRTGVVDEEYKPQAQGQLWITGRKWVDICSYHPEMPKVIVRITPDEIFMAKLAKLVRKFSLELEAVTIELREKYAWGEGDSPQAIRELLARSLAQQPYRGARAPDPDVLNFD